MNCANALECKTYYVTAVPNHCSVAFGKSRTYLFPDRKPKFPKKNTENHVNTNAKAKNAYAATL